jgi:hypothetical protein
MNTIPLVKGNTQEEINTSLIALKKALDEMNSSSGKTDASVQSQIKQINELITSINSHLDTIDGQITDLQPVDSVTSGNMQSVTSNAVSRAMSYSTSEVNTGKTWIDGRKIYRKVFTATLQTDEQVLNLAISNELQSFAKMEGTISKGNTDFPIPYCFIDGAKNYQVYCYCQGSNLFIIPRSSDGTYFTAGCVVRAIVEYTKTTD